MQNRNSVETNRGGPRRRQLLVRMGGALLATGAVSGVVTGQEAGVTVSLDNEGASAWEVTNVEGGGDVAPVGTENPTLTLRVGTRYTLENGGWSFHPLALRDESDDPLLTQDGTGEFENDTDVDWVDEGQTVSFTVTEPLAAALDDYICTIHSSMNGTVEIAESQEPAAAVTFTGQTTAGTSVTVDSVRVDDGGFVTMHDSTLLDGEALGSVVGVSEYLDPGSYDGVEVELDEELSEDQTLIAMPHRDSNGNETYDFVETDGGADGPYTDAEGALTDSAEVTVETDSDDGSDDGTDGGDDGADGGNDSADGGDDSADDGGPGFGPLASLAGLGGLASYAYRRLQRDTEQPTSTTDESDE
jgi:plastocyanin